MKHIKSHFEKFNKKDWQVILDLEKSEIGNEIYSPSTDLDEIKEYFSKCSVYLLLVEKQLAGYCAYVTQASEAEITALLVLKQFRRQGYGELMMKKLTKELASCNELKVITNPQNTIALKLYMKHGFIIVNRVENYWHGQPRLVLYRNK